MKLLIASRWFKPEMNPRSFRTTELVNELKKRGHEIDLFIPEGRECYSGNNLKVNKVAIINYKNKNSEVSTQSAVSLKSRFIRLLKDILVYFFGDSPVNAVYAWSLYKKIKPALEAGMYDAVISISFPFYVNVAVACAIRGRKRNSGVSIADCGDPFYYNPAIKRPVYLKWVEMFTLRNFDYISVPIEDQNRHIKLMSWRIKSE